VTFNLTKVDIQRQQENRISAFNKIKFALWNAQSLQKKSGLVCDIILSNRLDIFAIKEASLNSEGNNISLAAILNTLKDFTVIPSPKRICERWRRSIVSP